MPSASKVMLTLFWDFDGPILEHHKECGQTVSSVQYCAMLEEEVKPPICSQDRGMLINGGVLHLNNA